MTIWWWKENMDRYVIVAALATAVSIAPMPLQQIL